MLILKQFNKLFYKNVGRAGNTRIFFFLEEAKETVLDFPQGVVKVFLNGL